MIATIAKRFTFDAAHRLDRLPPDHKCHGMHGHTYEVELVFTGRVDENGFVMDYAEIAQMWQPLHQRIDHKVLNEVPGLEVPSTEHVAGWIFAHLTQWLRVRRGMGVPFEVTLDRVLVRESSSTWCECKLGNLASRDFEVFVVDPL